MTDLVNETPKERLIMLNNDIKDRCKSLSFCCIAKYWQGIKNC